ncbi:MAG: ATP-grasp protein-like protein [Phycisphaerales bacterium]|nr:ATP-grasp protein-like protein [Phycisphaerales bacterium]
MTETGLSTLRLLGRAGVTCYGLDAIEPLPAFWSRYCRRAVRLPPDSTDEQVIEAAIAFAAKLPPRPVLIPTSDRMVQLVSRARARLEPLYRLMLSDETLIEDLLDKSRFASRTGGTSALAPRGVTISGIAQVPDAVSQLGLPMILKPVRQGDIAGTNFPKVLLLETPEQVAHAREHYASCNGMRLVAQEYIPGPAEQQISVAACLDREGRALAAFTARKRRQGTNGTGVGLYVEAFHDPEAQDAAIALLKELKCVGINEVELKRHPQTGKLYVIEINPRVWLQVTLPFARGINFPQVLYSLAAGLAPPPIPQNGEAERPIAWQDFFHDGHATFRPHGYRAKGEISVLQWLKQSLRARTGPYAALRDPLPTMVWMCNVLGKLAFWKKA